MEFIQDSLAASGTSGEIYQDHVERLHEFYERMYSLPKIEIEIKTGEPVPKANLLIVFK
ncbi:hypothetical protein FH593_20620 (plasmid) [Leptospira interrogans]|uniref:hypothetical protein n=1 Tax=Leptospira interrogans TaxID=173 RepID=UPI0002BDA6D8|nr:hypothetical protein [Leptospira interrogans]EMN60316.1 hypothetical protein LEP1GSC092_0022 [Leptospira interrogans serovar Pyrogenes str. R168]ULG90648.1 hypothetical protein FH593_20620 [Leptospira interrogans]UML78424.1 hypothetical protein FH583_21775 [Leptospira interrogans]